MTAGHLPRPILEETMLGPTGAAGKRRRMAGCDESSRLRREPSGLAAASHRAEILVQPPQQ
ncbi:hypothetical protein ABTH50_19830, partial [Acinetobacter baumannii]